MTFDKPNLAYPRLKKWGINNPHIFKNIPSDMLIQNSFCKIDLMIIAPDNQILSPFYDKNRKEFI